MAIHRGSVPVEAFSYGNNQTLFGSNGQWLDNIDRPQVTFIPIQPEKDCGGNRRADTWVEAVFTDPDSKAIPGNGGWVQTNEPNDSLFTFHRNDWLAIDRSHDYSRLSDAGNSYSSRSDLPQFTLYLDGVLVPEQASAMASDPQTGVEPCGGGTGGAGGGLLAARIFDGGAKSRPEGGLFADLVVAPNPVRTTAEFFLKMPHAGTVGANLVDIAGRTVKAWDYGEMGPGTTRRALALDDVANGIYFLVVHTVRLSETETKIQKIAIAH